jgi:cephalosporin-C deacetylase
MFIDRPLDQLRDYRPALPDAPEFDAFWQRTLAEARTHDLDPVFTPVDPGLSRVIAEDVGFAGFGGHRIKGWFLRPAGVDGPLPTVVQYIGYNGGRGRVHDWLLWPSAGWATLIMDTRGQGAGWSAGSTPDAYAGTGPSVSGWMTNGILDPDDYYYRRLYTDGVRAVEAARSHPAVDPARIVAAGGSQGGAIAQAVSSLVPDLAYAFIDVPFMAHIEHATSITDEDPYGEIGRFLATQRDLAQRAFTTLAYFDGLNFATRNRTPALYSVGLRDGVTPASTVFAEFNHHAGPKEIRVWPFNGHNGGGPDQTAEQLALVAGGAVKPRS